MTQANPRQRNRASKTDKENPALQTDPAIRQHRAEAFNREAHEQYRRSGGLYGWPETEWVEPPTQPRAASPRTMPKAIERQCAVEGCRKEHAAKGMCGKHHYRWHSCGRPHVEAFIAAGAPVKTEWEARRKSEVAA